MKHKTYYRVLEIVWLVMALAAFVLFVRSLIKDGFYKDNLVLLGIAIISALMFLYRRKQRKIDSK